VGIIAARGAVRAHRSYNHFFVRPELIDARNPQQNSGEVSGRQRSRLFGVKPSFIIHTGDITISSKPSEFNDADASSRRPGSTCITCLANMTSSTGT